MARGEGDQCRWGDERDDKEQAVLQRRRIEETSPKLRSNERQAETSTSPTSQADETKVRDNSVCTKGLLLIILTEPL